MTLWFDMMHVVDTLSVTIILPCNTTVHSTNVLVIWKYLLYIHEHHRVLPFSLLIEGCGYLQVRQVSIQVASEPGG